MDQKDYLLREIEKIGTLLKRCFSKMTGSEDNLAIQLDVEFEEDKGMLLHELGFDMNLFLMLDEAEGGLSLGVGINSKMLLSTSVVNFDYAFRDFGRLQNIHNFTVGIKF